MSSAVLRTSLNRDTVAVNFLFGYELSKILPFFHPHSQVLASRYTGSHECRRRQFNTGTAVRG